MQTRARLGLAAGAVIMGLGIGITGAYLLDLMPGGAPAEQVREGGPGGPFTLVGHTGETVTDETFRGRLMLVFFGYTHCPDVCPTTLADMRTVLEELGEDAAAVQPIFVSVDPERDTPELLARYIPTFDERIVGLTGSPEQVKATAEAYGVWYEAVADEENPEFYLVNHTAAVFLMDRNGQFIRLFTFPAEAAEVVEAIRTELDAGSV